MQTRSKREQGGVGIIKVTNLNMCEFLFNWAAQTVACSVDGRSTVRVTLRCPQSNPQSPVTNVTDSSIRALIVVVNIQVVIQCGRK